MWLYKTENGESIILTDENTKLSAERAGLTLVGECDATGTLIEEISKKKK